MKKLNATIITGLMFVGISNVEANFDDSPPVRLSVGGTIKANSNLTIMIRKGQQPLMPDRFYKISCDIYNPSYNNSYPVVMRFKSSVGTILIDGVNLNPYRQAVLNHEITKYMIIGVPGPGWDVLLTFQNYDKSDNVVLRNCVASYMVD